MVNFRLFNLEEPYDFRGNFFNHKCNNIFKIYLNKSFKYNYKYVLLETKVEAQ